MKKTLNILAFLITVLVVSLGACLSANAEVQTGSCGDTYKEAGQPALGHKEIVDNAVEPTCTKSGLTEGSHCAVCKQIIIEQEVIAAKSHTTQTINGTPAKASLTITWAKVKGVKGYEIQLATDKKFKKNLKKATIKKQKTTKKTVKKLKGKQTYYVRIRTYKTKKVNGKSTKVYSSWSKVKTVKTK